MGKRILSIDGGGMKGLIPCAFLAELERRAGKPCNEIFDMFYGTSVGSILAGGLSVGIPAKSLQEFFTIDGPKIFSPSWYAGIKTLFGSKYGASGIETALKARFGTKMLSEAKCKLGIVAFDVQSYTSMFFKSFDDSQHTLLWEAMRASSAAQTYFPSFKLAGGVYIDGGNVANNPAMCAYADSVKLWGDADRVEILSLGCGPAVQPFTGAQMDGAGLLKNGIETINVLFDGSDEIPNYQLAQMLGDDFHRCDPKDVCSLDDASQKGLQRLQSAALRFVLDHAATLEYFAHTPTPA